MLHSNNIRTTGGMTGKKSVIWAPQLDRLGNPGPQYFAVTTIADITGYLGTRGGGKTDVSIGRNIIKAEKYGFRHSGLIIRKRYKDFAEMRRRWDELKMQGLPIDRIGGDNQLNVVRFNAGQYKGAQVQMAAIQRLELLDAFQGQQFDEITIEEAGQFPFIQKMIENLKGCMRSPHGVPCHMFLTGNPGGPGTAFLRMNFVKAAPPYTIIKDEDGFTRCYIPSSVEDNMRLIEKDPKYVMRLRSIKDPALRKAWYEGNWDVVLGGFFEDVYDESKIIIPQFSVPHYWPRIMGLDWGTFYPFSIGWYAVSDGSWIPEISRALPAGALVRYREWYGCMPNEPNTGIRMGAADVAEEILRREKSAGEGRLSWIRVADPKIFSTDDGPTIAQKMERVGVVFQRADNSRIAGWEAMRMLLRGVNGVPLLYITENCPAWKETVPTLERDETNWDDVDCFIAGTMIATPNGEVPIENLGVGDLVETPIGPRPIIRAFSYKAKKTTIVKLSSNIYLEGTNDHKIMTEKYGLLPLCKLSLGICITTLRESQWLKTFITKEEDLPNIREEDILSVIYGLQKYLEQHFCTEPYGKRRLEKSLMVLQSITGTETLQTMTLKTFNSFIRAIMLDTISTKGLLPVGISGKLLIGGEKAIGDKRFYEKALKNAAAILPKENLRALIVASLLKRSTQEKNIAQKSVSNYHQSARSKSNVQYAEKFSIQKAAVLGKQRPVVLSVDGRSEEKIVYNIEVEQAHCFFANGVMTTNTDGEDHASDETRYVIMARPSSILHQANVEECTY